MISKELSATLGFAVREAKKRRHEYVSIEHILFAILYDPTGIEIIENCGGTVENLLENLEQFFEEKIETIPEDSEYVLQQTIGFQRVIQRAVNHARSAEKPGHTWPISSAYSQPRSCGRMSRSSIRPPGRRLLRASASADGGSTT